MKNSSLTILLLCTQLIVSQTLSARTFTNTKGQKIEASVVEVIGEKVKLQLDKSGKTYLIPISSLSTKDQEHVKSWTQTSKKENDSSDRASKDESNPKNNFDDPWPKLVSIDLNIDIITVEEDAKSKRFVYHSPNYEFICDVGLSKNVIKKFASLFEATREYCRLLPISTLKAHVPGAQFRHKILLFERKETYIRNGGPPSSAGVFMSRGGKGVVMAPLTSLGLKKVGSSYMYDYKGSNEVLPHELTHQLTDQEYYNRGARGWFSEGLAEYIAVTPYRSGKFMVRSNLSAIKAYATGYGKKGRGGRGLGNEIHAPDLKEYMLQPYSQFTSNANFNYGLGLLITNYYFHMEDDRSNIIAFLKALKNGKKDEEALNVLLNGRTWDEMEKAISKAWRSRGVRITFR